MEKLYLVLSFLLCVVAETSAVPAYRGAIKALQSDGTEITFYLYGDEHCNECVSVDGYRLLQDETGTYRYASTGKDGRLTVGNAPIAHDPALRTVEEMSYIKGLKKADELAGQVAQTNRKATAIRKIGAVESGKASRFQIGTFPTIGEGRCLVLLVEFADAKFTLSKDFHERMLNEENFSEDGATGSARDYYLAQSCGQFYPSFDVYGPITLSRNMAYYGADDAFQGVDYNVGNMVYEACTLAASTYGVDFSRYDGDGDGMVDMVYLIYAGYGQNAGAGSNAVWPHKYQLSSWNMGLSLGGKIIDTYACSAELAGNSGVASAGIGTVCHEFGHVLGLADHYNTSGNDTYYCLGSYDIMDYGAYNNNGHTPPAYTAFERMSLGWLTPDVLDAPGDGLTLEHLETSNRAYLIETASADEFYLLENKQQEGWDSYIPGNGMMITHVVYSQAEWNANTLNTDNTALRYSLVPADNDLGYDAYSEESQTEEHDLYPYILGENIVNDSFTDSSQPAATPWTGDRLDKWVTSIRNGNDGVVSFDFMPNHLVVPGELRATVDVNFGFTASWAAVPKAESYNLNLYKLQPTSELTKVVDEGFGLMVDGSADNAASEDVSGSLDKYMTTAGWSGENVHQAGGWCQVGSENAGGKLVSPGYNMRRFDGEFTVAVTAKALTGKTPVLGVSANGLQGRTRITSTARTYVFRFTGGVSETAISFTSNSERALIDSIVIVRGDGNGMFDTAKEVEVTGEPELIEDGEIVDTDFAHTDTTTISGVSGTEYVFTGLEDGAYYSFTVTAYNAEASSAESEECMALVSGVAGIRAISSETGSNEELYTIGGVRIGKVVRPGIYIMRKDGRTVKRIIK